ncbi:uncharacterized protein METZ01_LOCUS455986, partial [marine metagenome]
MSLEISTRGESMPFHSTKRTAKL